MDQLLEDLLSQARKQGINEIELFYLQDRGLKIRVFEGKVDTFGVSRSCGLGIRVLLEGRCGLSYTEKIDRSSLKTTLNLAIANSRINPIDPCHQISGPKPLPSTRNNLVDEKIGQKEVNEKIKLTLKMEQIARNYHPQIINVPYATYFEGWREVRILNSAGFQGCYQKGGWGVAIEVMAQKGNEIKSPYKWVYANKLEALNPEDIALKTAQEAINRLGSFEPKSGTYQVIFLNEVAKELLATFAGAFSAKNVQKGLSLLAGKLGQKIASDKVTLMDNALLENGFASRPFDDEGTASSCTEVINTGLLKTFLHNRYTACKDGVASTGNASRPSIKSALEIAPSNFYLAPGSNSLTELMAQAGKGILLVELDGLHSGANPVSGDFSLGAQGYLFNKGQIQYPLHNFTVSGNFFELLKDIIALGNDLDFSPPTAGSAIGSPSILVSNLSISGS
jgi:PmbA protein